MNLTNRQADVIVIGSGNAAFSAALTAREHGAEVLMLEKSPQEWIGGNSWFTAGAYRLTHAGVEDLADLIEPPDRPTEVPPYLFEDYERDMQRLTEGRCDPDLTRVLVTEARESARWMRSQGVRWRLMTERQAHVSNGRVRFWGGLAVGTVGGGAGLIEAYCAAAKRAKVDLAVDSEVDDIIVEDGAVVGVQVRTVEGPRIVRGAAVVLASGGFEANPELRAKHLGEQWRHALVRGTPHNTGEILMRTVDLGAQPFGHWEGCHAIAWDAAASAHGDRSVSNRYSRQGYPLGVVVNLRGERFVDEGADFRNYTYAKYGAAILTQPSGKAFQLFDSKTAGLISSIDYETATQSRYEAQDIGQLAERAGIDRDGLTRTIADFNAAVTDAPFDPTVLDGKGTVGIAPPKSNWAQRLDSPPYLAFGVACGVTFTFGGVRIDLDGRVLDRAGNTIPGLFAAGEVVGGLFYHNYPGGTGLASGTVFGRRAGHAAAHHVGRGCAA